MNKSSGISYLNSNSQTTTQDNSDQQAIFKIRHEASRDLIEMLQSMFDGIDDSFFELANNARTNNEQNRFFETMREIRIKRKGIESEFENAINQQFSSNKVLQKNKDQTIQANNTSLDSLTLVQNDDLEEDVAITTMSTKAKSNFQGPLLQFHARIGKLYGISDLDQSTPPLDPKDISKAFTQACTNIETQIKEKLIIYKQFDRYVLCNLGTVLENANKTLIKLGVMPSLKTPGVRQKHSPKSETTSSPIIKNTVPTNSNEATTFSNTLPHLQSLLANIRTRSSQTNINQQSTENAHMINTQDLIDMLTELQKAPSTAYNEDNQSSVIDIHTALQSSLHKNTPHKTKKPTFTQTDEDLINLVSMLFEFILEDYNLAPPIQVLISRLQIPILKVVIKDNSFFSSNNHPARQLLNSLAKAGIGWGEQKNTHHDPLYKKIHDTVHTILNKFTGDITLFEQLNNDFKLFISKDERKTRLVEQRTKEAEIGLIKSRQAQKSVETSINQLIESAQHPISDFIIETLKNGWSRVMFLAFLKDEQEHQWLNVNKLAEDLIWCLQPLKTQADRQRWITVAPKLLKDLRSGLEDVSYKTAELDTTIKNIRIELTSSFKNSTFDDIDNSNNGNNGNNTQHKPINLNKTASSDDKSAVTRQLESKDTKLAEYYTEIDSIEVGTWLEFTLLNNSKYRCKLSTKLPEADCYVFVNRMGLKTIEKTKSELASDLSKKQAVILEQGLMIDRAMNAVTSKLRQKANA